MTWAWLAHVRRRRELPLLVVVALRDRAARRGRARTWSLDVRRWTPPRSRELVGADRAERAAGAQRRQPAAADRARPGGRRGARRGPGLAARGGVGPAAAYRRRGADAPGGRRPRRDGIDLDLLAAVLGTRAAGRAEPPRRRASARRSSPSAQGSLAFRHELVRLAVAAEAGRGPAGLAAPARRRGAAARDRTRTRSSWPGTPARAATARWRPTGLAHAADLALARLDLAGAERLLDEAIELHDSGAAAAAAQPGADVARRPGRRRRRRRARDGDRRHRRGARAARLGGPQPARPRRRRSGSAGPRPPPRPTRRSGPAA